ncbi:MAG: carboxylating nicotinate-nucleotide diphosphorylase [Hyphomicrobiaceae bacterium]|nr:carboxylating nicotinate-nucleotide diphosphorylase [Hyphomicrobiaceae bacterium]
MSASVSLPSPGPLPRSLVQHAVAAALAEDVGLAGDLTTNATIPPDARSSVVIVARHAGVVSGLDLATAAFRALDPAIALERAVADGDHVDTGVVLARIEGATRAILTGERVALNFLGRLSGIATLTRAYVDAVAGTRAAIADTRKTTPGLRAFEKYAVRCGGGVNHRFGLFDAILIKDNHIAAAGSLTAAVTAARAHAGHLVKVEVEVDTLDQLEAALRLPVDVVLLDNMAPSMLREAVAMAGGRVLLEASGGVSLATVRAIAETGVDLISVGALTHSAPVLDLGLDYVGKG